MNTKHPDSKTVARKVVRYVLQREPLMRYREEEIVEEITHIIDGDMWVTYEAYRELRDKHPAPAQPAPPAVESPSLCHVCGLGHFLPSGICDTCDAEKPADMIAADGGSGTHDEAYRRWQDHQLSEEGSVSMRDAWYGGMAYKEQQTSVRLKEAHAENEEQARLLGASASREAALLAKLAIKMNTPNRSTGETLTP